MATFLRVDPGARPLSSLSSEVQHDDDATCIMFHLPRWIASRCIRPIFIKTSPIKRMCTVILDIPIHGIWTTKQTN